MVPNDKKSSKTSLTPSAPPVTRPRLDESQVIGCEYGHYPWDDWERWAVTQGVPKDLAALGRSLVREADQHGWEEELKSLCGWRDDGRAMLALALAKPKTARRQWEILMRTDGLRGDYWRKGMEWTWGALKSDARRLLAQIQRL